MSAATFVWAVDENGNDVQLRLPLRVQITADSSTPVPVQQAHLTATNDTVSAVILADEQTPVPVQQAALTVGNDTVMAVVTGDRLPTSLSPNGGFKVTVLADDANPVSVQQAALTAANDTVTAVVSSSVLPTGASTEATVAGIKTGTDRLPAQGQALMAGSLPVTLASNQSTLPITFPADQLIHATNLDAALSTRATEATLALIKAKTDNLDATISSLVTATAAALAAGEAHIGAVGGTTTIVSDEFARVSDSNAYTAGDAIGATVSDTGTTALRALTNVARVNQGSGYLTKFRLWTDQKTCTARIRVHFYTVSAPTTAVVGDNVPMTLYWANRAQRIGTVDMPALATETDSTNSTAAHTIDLTTRLAFTCAAATRTIYYRIATLDAFTPASGQQFFLECAAETN